MASSTVLTPTGRGNASSSRLRAALRLTRLWPRHGKRAEADELLVPIDGGQCG